MSCIRVNRSFAIIGVVGQTNPPQDLEKILVHAKDLGMAIVKSGNAVLTGGHHRCNENSVKYCALLGAMNVRDDSRCNLLIGVVPKSISDKLGVKDCKIELPPPDDAGIGLQYIYVHTRLESQERDEITGQLADVLIALPGEKGTPREVAAAIMAGRKVVFFQSLSILRDKVIEEMKSFAEKNGVELKPFPSPPLEAKTVDEALDKALSAIAYGKSPQYFEGCLQDKKLPQNIVNEFNSELSRMQMSDRQNIAELRELSREINEAEKLRNVEFFSSLIAEEFTFRRANKAIVDKGTFLAELRSTANTYEMLESSDISATVYEGVAIVTLLVQAKGKRNGNIFQGVYRNIRIFVHEPEKEQPWQLHAWFNVRVPDADP